MNKRILKKWNKSFKYIQDMPMTIGDHLLPDEETQGQRNTAGILCHQPFYFMEITTSGEVYTCCPGWIKFPIGNIKNNTIAEIWNGNRARYIRRKLYLGEWEKICNPICPRIAVYKHDKHLIHYDYLETFDYLTPQLISEIRSGKEHLNSSPTVFNLSNSKICNLSCIMCDRLSQDDDPQVIEKTAKDIFQHLPNARQLVLSGMGDPFARPDTRDLLMNFDGRNSDLRFNLITNGLLLPRYWEKVKHQKFGTLLISVDAFKKETYEKIRIGGSWEDLLQSLKLVKENRDKFSSVTLNMTVMRHNYREIPEFIDFAESYGFDASFQRIRGDYGDQNFFQKPDDHTLNELGEIIIKEQLKHRQVKVFFSDLLEFTFVGFARYKQKGEVKEYKEGPGTCVIYDKTPGDIATPAEVNFGNKVKLAGITVDKLSQKQFMIAYDWQILDAPGKYKQIFVHFTDSKGTILFQNDHELCSGKSLESIKGKSIKEIYVIDIPETAIGQEINVRIGVYLPEPDYPRLTIKSSGGMITGDNNTYVIFQKFNLLDTNPEIHKVT
jgi:MoaA/NifB/PqqE/SkfB family radical SAM enzyme